MSIFLSIFYIYLYIYINFYFYIYLYLPLHLYLYLYIYLKGLHYHRDDIQTPSHPWTKPEYIYIYVMLCYVMLCYVMLCYVMLCYVMLCIYMYISRTFFVTSFRGHLDQKEKNATYNILVRQVTSFLLCEVTFLWVWVSQMGLGYRFRATSLTCYSPLGLRLRLPPCNACQSVSSVSEKGHLGHSAGFGSTYLFSS